MESYIIIRNKDNAQAAASLIWDIPIDGSHEVLIREAKSGRSSKQRRLQWKWYSEIGSSWGWETKEVRDYYMKKYAINIFYRDDINGSANSIDVIRDLKAEGMKMHYNEMVNCFVKNITSNSFNVKQNHEYLEQIDRHASQQGMRLTIPGEMQSIYMRGER